ncbi:50S ribosomal protein L28 [Simkania negevensis]|uniref:Large ribosomal subunit protein bL28 n=1 Tax=Simkania negevensis TaxID=83561 RepID=A0ABS3AST2_9BACT|nr:50S ribosomal protein L28 [Simkania negevensis]
MSKCCQLTKKKPVAGRTYTTRGIAKKKKGIGLKITGKTARRFCPNLFKKRFWYAEENRFVTLKLSVAAFRTMNKVGVHRIVTQLRSEGQKV